MLSASRSLSKARATGEPLPSLDHLLDLREGYFRYRPRRSEVTMIAGMPGSQKSGFAIWLVSQFNVPTLYFSADMAQHTAISRLAAAVTGDTIDSVKDAMFMGQQAYYEDALDGSPVRFVYNPNPTMQDVVGELDAWVEAWDSFPQVIVIDNLLDVVPSAGDTEHSGYKVTLLETKTLARETSAAIFILHHMSETGTDPDRPAPRKAVMGKASQSPENILSVALPPESDEFLVSVVKHRSGPSDATGKRFERLRITPERNRFERWTDAASRRRDNEEFWALVEKERQNG